MMDNYKNLTDMDRLNLFERILSALTPETSFNKHVMWMQLIEKGGSKEGQNDAERSQR